MLAPMPASCATNMFRQIPGVDALLATAALAGVPSVLARLAVRQVLDETRTAIKAGELTELPDLQAACVARVEALRGQKLRGVVNATGIVLHTNLGRAPLAPEAAAAVAEVAAGYSNAELDLATGKRGGRLRGVREPLKLLLGCEDAIAVNNNAAAVVLVLAALAKGREVIVSRGELVEIGGSFRVPDIMAASGATMVEVGTTNRTRAADYARALSPETALVLKVHRSNFKVVGFTEEAGTAELAALGVPLFQDLGSGALLDGVADEPLVSQVLQDGAALVCFSGDKLLGGPQAGILAGRADLVKACRQHPLYRALRLDKLVLAGLEATLRLVLAGEPMALPTQRMLREDPSPRARDFAARLAAAGVDAETEADVAYTGGGALPQHPLPGEVVAIRTTGASKVARALRLGSPPVVARVARDTLLLDLRTVLPEQEDALNSAVLLALRA
jgi:L-seryl-tRNA(Ser) seleniumtransferase